MASPDTGARAAPAAQRSASFQQQDESIQAGNAPEPETLYSLVDPKAPQRLQAMGGVDGLLRALHSSREQGLDGAYRSQSRERYGANKLPDLDFKPLWRLIYEALQDKTLIMLIVAAGISMAVSMSTEGPAKGWKDGTAVLIAVAVVVTITSANDYSKERQFRKLNDVKNDRQVSILRHGGQRERISIFDLAVGDVVFLDTGDVVPADGVFVHGEGMKADESSATGESRAVEKGLEGRQDPFLLSGTQIIEGGGAMVVIAVGPLSFNGRIMLSLRTPSEDTPLQLKLARFANAIGNFGIAAAVLVFLAQLIKYFAMQHGHVDKKDALHNCVDFLVIAISIVVVAVPEGLPLAVTISLAYSMRYMMRDNNLVRHLEACETMGGATTVCSDKTGTLTQNRMTVVQGWLLTRRLHVDEEGKMSQEQQGSSGSSAFVVDQQGHSADMADSALHHLFACICVNSTAYKADAAKTSDNAQGASNGANPAAPKKNNAKNGRPAAERISSASYVGSQTECALLAFAEKCGQDYEQWRKDADVVKIHAFSSERKRMSVVVKQMEAGRAKEAGDDSQPLVLYTKGAAEVVLKLCSRYIKADGSVADMDSAIRQQIQDTIGEMNNQALRALSLAYRPCSDDHDYTDDKEPQLIYLGVAGILDPLRPEIKDAVAKCHRAGVVVRMVTGDSLAIAKTIASSCGIYKADTSGSGQGSGHLALEGPEFRKMSEAEVIKILPRLRILARSSPNDKFKLVSALQAQGEVVAVTGDGVNDGPALKKADVGFAMGLSGTEVAKEAADIVLLDDNFASIVNAIKWGRSVFDNIRKFLQFQLTVNFSAILIILISVLVQSKGASSADTPLKPVQLLWINLIMDSFAALALATELPTEVLLELKPFDRQEPLLTRFMLRRMAMMVVLQTTTFLVLLYAFPDVLGTGRASELEANRQFTDRHLTFVFNAFVLSQLVNQINCRKLRGEINVFAGLWRHRIFWMIWLLAVGIQFAFVQYGGSPVETQALTAWQWLGCVVVAVLPFVWSFLFVLLPRKVTTDAWPWYDKLMGAVVTRVFYMLPFLRRRMRRVVAQHVAAQQEEGRSRVSLSGNAGGGPTTPAAASVNDQQLSEHEDDERTSLLRPSTALSSVPPTPLTDEEVDSQARERWRHVLWATLAEVHVVEAFRRKRR